MTEIRINPLLLYGAWSDLNQIWFRATALEFALNCVQTTKTCCLMELNTYNFASLFFTEFKISEAYWRYIFITPFIYRLIDSSTEQWTCRIFLILLYNLEGTLSVTYLDFNIHYWMSRHFHLENADTSVKVGLKWSISYIS